jgi:hypothetical protein
LIDKDNIRLADTGPFEFGIAPMVLAGSDPPSGATGTDPTASPRLFFNGLPDQASLAGNITFTGGTTDPAFTLTAVDDAVVLALPAGANLEEMTEYTITVDIDGGSIEDIAGGPLTGDDVTITFTTGDIPTMTAN